MKWNIPAKSDPAFFLIGGRIAYGEGQVIFQEGHGVGEADSVFGEVRAGLGWIPLVTHGCTFVHTSQFSRQKD
jgi:hypothetical protein